MQPTGEEEAHAAYILCCWWYWQTVCRQTLDTVHLEVGGLVIQIDYDDFVEWMREVVAGLWWLLNPTTRLRRKSAWLWRLTEKPSEALRRQCECHVRAEISTHTEFARWSLLLSLLCDWQMIGESHSTGYVWHRLWQLHHLVTRLDWFVDYVWWWSYTGT